MTVDVHAKGHEFAQEVQELINATLPLPGGASPEVMRVVTATIGPYYAIHPGSEENPTKQKLLPLLSEGEHVANLKLFYHCTLDHEQRFLAIRKSTFELQGHGREDSSPIIRIDYERDAHSTPTAHWNVHAERGSVSHMLAQTNPRHCGKLSKVHLPVGGARHRPCLEDILQLLFTDFRFDKKPGAQRAIDEGRERWRRLQTATLVRDAPDTAAEVLAELGYTVAPPNGKHAETKTFALQRY